MAENRRHLLRHGLETSTVRDLAQYAGEYEVGFLVTPEEEAAFAEKQQTRATLSAALQQLTGESEGGPHSTAYIAGSDAAGAFEDAAVALVCARLMRLIPDRADVIRWVWHSYPDVQSQLLRAELTDLPEEPAQTVAHSSEQAADDPKYPTFLLALRPRDEWGLSLDDWREALHALGTAEVGPLDLAEYPMLPQVMGAYLLGHAISDDDAPAGTKEAADRLFALAKRE